MKEYFKAWVYYKYIQSICLHIQMSDWSQIKHKTDRKPIYISTYTLQTRLYTVTGHIKCQNIDIDLYTDNESTSHRKAWNNFTDNEFYWKATKF
jgi:hypothetical protein